MKRFCSEITHMKMGMVKEESRKEADQTINVNFLNVILL
jgi:hypothetical protein